MALYELDGKAPQMGASAWVADSAEVIGAVELGDNASVWFGAVIRGDTPHFDYVAGEAAKGIGSAMMQAQIPIVFGVLTTNTLEQALDRAGAKSGNKGYDAAQTVIEMANLLRELRA